MNWKPILDACKAAIHKVTPEKLQFKDKEGDSRLYWLATVNHDAKTLNAFPLTNPNRGFWGHAFLTAITGSLYLFYLLGRKIQKQWGVNQATQATQRALAAISQTDAKPISTTGTDKIRRIKETTKPLEKETKGEPVVLPHKDPLLSRGITQTSEWQAETGRRKQAHKAGEEKLLKKKSFGSGSRAG